MKLVATFGLALFFAVIPFTDEFLSRMELHRLCEEQGGVRIFVPTKFPASHWDKWAGFRRECLNPPGPTFSKLGFQGLRRPVDCGPYVARQDFSMSELDWFVGLSFYRHAVTITTATGEVIYEHARFSSKPGWILEGLGALIGDSAGSHCGKEDFSTDGLFLKTAPSEPTYEK
ncbi:MAG: hypothetical protein M3O62_06620 [Pseudomonadota bacterium]|nr:hypothetical protein [Pseudomonadota bacterium]